MSYRILLTPPAEEQLRAASSWWQENRLASPGLLVEELDRAIEMLRELPGLGARFHRGTIPGVRRVLLRRSGYWVYYLPDEARAVVYVLAVWSGRRGTAPRLGSPKREV